MNRTRQGVALVIVAALAAFTILAMRPPEQVVVAMAATTTTLAPTTTTTVAPTSTAPAPTTTAPTTTVPPVDPTLPTLTEALRNAPQYSDYVRLLEAASYPDDFDRLQAYTLFAPTNEALADAGYDIDEVIADVDPTLLFEVLSDTVAIGRLELADLPDELQMLSGNAFPISDDGTTVTFDGLPIVGEPIRAVNGIIHGLGALAPR